MNGPLAGFSNFVISITLIASWLTGVIHSAVTSNVVMLILDLVIPPVAVIHGVGVWFGVW